MLEEHEVEPLDPARRRLLRLVAERPAGPPLTVAELTTTVGGHPNTARHHLRALVAAGLVSEERGPATGGRGRPATRYAVTRAGRGAVAAPGGGAAAQEYVALAAAFADRLAERDGDPGADSRGIGKAWGATLAERRTCNEGGVERPPVEQVVGLLDRLGFSPHVEPTRVPDSGPIVLLQTCPLLDAARRHPEVVCQVHLGLVAGALEAHHQPSDGLGLQPFARPGACELALPSTL